MARFIIDKYVLRNNGKAEYTNIKNSLTGHFWFEANTVEKAIEVLSSTATEDTSYILKIGTDEGFKPIRKISVNKGELRILFNRVV